MHDLDLSLQPLLQNGVTGILLLTPTLVQVLITVPSVLAMLLILETVLSTHPHGRVGGGNK